MLVLTREHMRPGCAVRHQSSGTGRQCLGRRIAARTRAGAPSNLIQHHRHITVAAMTALYKPTEAISLLRPSLLLPRIQPSPTRRARAAFSTTRHAPAKEPTFPGTPFPEPTRKSITLAGDTGRVRWNELSPGEKVVRTTQQSFNLIIVAVGVVATVWAPLLLCHNMILTCKGRRSILPLQRRLQSQLQNRLLQRSHRKGAARPSVPETAGRGLPDRSVRREFFQSLCEESLHKQHGRDGQVGHRAFEVQVLCRGQWQAGRSARAFGQEAEHGNVRVCGIDGRCQGTSQY